MANSDQSIILVLAAGRGRRMGGPKALMNVGGRPWWRWQAETLHALGAPTFWVVSQEVADKMVSSGSPSQREGVGGRANSNGHQPPVVLADPDAPMFTSITRGIAAIASNPNTPPGRGIFILPVDVPAPAPDVWRQLDHADHPTIPEFNGRRGHPVYLPWPWVRANIMTVTVANQRLDQLMKPDLRSISVTDHAVTVNLNTPADVEAWLCAREGRREAAAP